MDIEHSPITALLFLKDPIMGKIKRKKPLLEVKWKFLLLVL